MRKIKISVLTPVYNTPLPYLKEMMESVLSQTYSDFEFIILNDSPENIDLEKQVLSYNDPRIRYIRNDHNMGIAASRNKLLSLAQGEYVAILDHDDVCLPQRFEKEIHFLDNNPSYGVVSGNIVFFPEDPHTTNYPQDNQEIKLALLKGCYVVHTAAMLRKSVIDKNNIHYESVYSPSEDYMLWIRLIGVTMFHNLPDILVKYRCYKTNTSHQQAAQMQDKTLLIQNVAYSTYPYLFQYIQSYPQKRWIYLFGFLPFIKIVHINHSKSKYFLFGFILIGKAKRIMNTKFSLYNIY